MMQEQGIAFCVTVIHSTPAMQAELTERTCPLAPDATRQTLEGPDAARISPLVVTMLQGIAATPEDALVTIPSALTVTEALV
jgi:hypothetical protein